MFKLGAKHTLLEMAQVGTFAGYTCSVYGKEGSLPYFHFYTKDKKISGCIRLDAPDYFVHGKHKAKLNSKEKKQLIEWLQSKETPFKKFTDVLTVWEYICILWNENNLDAPMDLNIKMPDYSQLPCKD
jgi:hypothetical protein